MSESYCYVGRKAGEPGAYAACADRPEFVKETAKFISGILKKGGFVERVPTDDARKMLGEWLEWKRPKKEPEVIV